MWSGFFFYSPRPPSQKPALEFLTVLVVSVNVMYMLVLLYSMCSETCREHENNSVVKMFRKKTSNLTQVMKRRTTAGDTFVHRRGTQHFQNPAMQQEMVEIEMASRNDNSNGHRSTSRPEAVALSKKSGGGMTKKNSAKKNKMNKTKSRKKRPKKQQAPIKKTVAQQERRNKLNSIHAKRQSVDALNAGTSVVAEQERDGVAMGISNSHKRKSFLKIDDEEHGVYFQDVDTEETVWVLPEDGDVVVNDNELQHNPMKRKSFRKIVDEEHGAYFQDVDTEETVWELPKDGDVVVEDTE